MLHYNDEPYVLLCDNVSSHVNPVNFGDQGEIMCLPKYSPFLNVAETAGSCVKASSKRVMATPEVQQEIYDRGGGGGRPRGVETLHNQRIRIVKREFENAIPMTTVNKWGIYASYIVIHTTIYLTGRSSWLN